MLEGGACWDPFLAPMVLDGDWDEMMLDGGFTGRLIGWVEGEEEIGGWMLAGVWEVWEVNFESFETCWGPRLPPVILGGGWDGCILAARDFNGGLLGGSETSFLAGVDGLGGDASGGGAGGWGGGLVCRDPGHGFTCEGPGFCSGLSSSG